MNNENINLKRVDCISKQIKDTVDCSYRAGYAEGFEAGKRTRTNDLDDVTLMSLRSIQHCLENAIPTIEIVYCKDCKYYKPLYGGAFNTRHMICERTDQYPEETDFCSKGERKESEEE